ncbi:hypothetical protein [Legionella sp. W05-934-2]|uniref:hypothetical protein n=1 Tax=Legionella sp. W05-934-2 TaxID=1198649 RepID=UPI0034621FB6
MIQINKLLGTTGLPFQKSYHDHGPVFFRPYTSFSDVAYRSASIIAAPVLFTLLSAATLLAAIVDLGKSLIALINGDSSKSWHKLKEAGSTVAAAGFILIVAALSPIVNLVDSLASVVTTFTQKKDVNQFRRINEVDFSQIELESPELPQFQPTNTA